MSTTTKTIYVVGGTNGVGKSTIREELLDPSIPYVNSDFIAKELKGSQSSLMLVQLAQEYGSAQIKKYVAIPAAQPTCRERCDRLQESGAVPMGPAFSIFFERCNAGCFPQSSRFYRRGSESI